MRLEKFRRGDLVQIAKHLPSSMAHFPCGKRAIVIGSYRDQFGGSDCKSYTIFIERYGETSWYHEDQLTLIEKRRHDLLESWEDQKESFKRDAQSLSWIRANWDQIKLSPPTLSILKLFECVGFYSTFCRNGEYYCLLEDWEKWLPILDFIVKSETIEEFRSKQNPEATQEQVKLCESIWNHIHADV